MILSLVLFGSFRRPHAPGEFPEGAPFWDWSVGTINSVLYPLTVVLQEFLARGVMQESLRRIFYGKYAGVLGVLYHKQGNIWGLCIVHYVLGQVATFLRFI